MVTQRIKLNLIPGGIRPRIKASQYDAGARTLVFKLYNGSQEFSVPNGSTVSIRGTKSDHTGFQYECTYSGSEVTAQITDQMTVSPGEVLAELVITKGDDRIATGNFIFDNEEAALKDDVIVSHTDIPAIERLDDLVYLVEEDTARAEAAKTAAEAAVTQASQSAQAAASSASQASTSAANASNSATAASTSAANASASESNALASKNAAKASEDNAKASETAANASKNAAASSASQAATSATNAINSASAAATSEQNASESETNAAASATAASGSASSARTSASQAATSASSAASSESNAATSETNAGNYATQAASSAQTASTAASNASTSASSASTSATNAANSETLARKWAVGDSGSGTNVPSDTNNAYYWAQVAQRAAGGGLTIEVVAALPTTDISVTKIYLVPSSDPESQNVKDEYINLDGTTSGWELIGSTAIDLSGYYTKTQVDAIIQGVKDYADGKLAELKEYAESKLDEDYANVYGAKNLFPYPYKPVAFNLNNMEYTDNGDGSVTFNGSSTNSSNLYMFGTNNTMYSKNIPVEGGKKYIVSSGIENETYGYFSIFAYTTETFDNNKAVIARSNSTPVLDLTNVEEIYGYRALVHFENGITVNDLTIKPMIRLASIKDDTWVPYAKTNKQLTEDVKKISPYTFDTLEQAQAAVQAGEVPDGAIVYIPSGGVFEDMGFSIVDGALCQTYETGD